MTANVNEVFEEGVQEYENALVHTGFGWYNLFLLLLGGGSMISVVTESTGLSYVLPAAQCDLELSIFDKSVLSSIGFFGIVLSCLFWGYLADSFGRRKMLVISTWTSCCLGVISSIVPTVWLLIVCRFLNGFFIGCPASIAMPFIGEFHSANYRSKIISWTGSFITASIIYMPAISWVILPMEWAYPIPFLNIIMSPWRLVIILMSLPTFLAALTYMRFPESPKYLWSIGKSEESLSILRNMYKMNTGKDKILYPVTKFALNTKTEQTANQSEVAKKSENYLIYKLFKKLWSQMAPLFMMPLLPNMLNTSFLQYGIQSGAQGVLMWIPDIINTLILFQNENPNMPVTVCNAYDYKHHYNFTNLTEVEDNCTDVVDINVFKITSIYGLIYTLVFLVIGFIVDIIGKKLLIVIILTFAAVGGGLLNLVQGMNIIIVCIGLFQMLAPCMNLVISVQMDLFPTQHRAKAIAISQMMGRIGAITGSGLVGFLMEFYCPLVFYLFPALLIALIVVCLLLPIPLIIRRIPNTDSSLS